jgi:LPS export ABC transporter protein LptC
MIIAYEFVRPKQSARRWAQAGMRVRHAAASLLVALLCVTPAAALEGVDDNTSALRMSKMTFIDGRDGHTEVVLDAARVYLPPRSDVAQLEEVRVRMVQARAIGESLLMTCDRGDMVLGRSDFRAEGNVRGRTGDGRQFFTTWVRYDSHAQILSTDAPVRILDGIRTLQGVGFRYNVRDGRLAITSGATVLQE